MKVSLIGALLIGGCDRSPTARQVTPPSPRTQPVGPATRPAAVPATKPVAAVTHVIIISVDGLRPDLIFRSAADTINALAESGTFTFWANSADLPLTLPSHSSMFTGVKPSRHGIEFNEGEPNIYPAYPTLFEIAHANGLTTALVTGKIKLQILARPGSLDWQSVQEQDCEAVANEAITILNQHKPNLLGIHFNDCDYAGHAWSWGSQNQLRAVKRIDGCVGRILTAIDEAKLTDSTVVILTADHGGSGVGHATDKPGSTIPWIVRGPGIRKGFDLDRMGFFTVHVEDTFATASMLLGLPIHPDIDGKPVRQILQTEPGQELLMDSP
jgi:arylsulfatase A-like enzyme